jgi:hypothetical protein
MKTVFRNLSEVVHVWTSQYKIIAVIKKIGKKQATGCYDCGQLRIEFPEDDTPYRKPDLPFEDERLAQYS